MQTTSRLCVSPFSQFDSRCRCPNHRRRRRRFRIQATIHSQLINKWRSNKFWFFILFGYQFTMPNHSPTFNRSVIASGEKMASQSGIHWPQSTNRTMRMRPLEFTICINLHFRELALVPRNRNAQIDSHNCNSLKYTVFEKQAQSLRCQTKTEFIRFDLISFIQFFFLFYRFHRLVVCL